MKHRRLALSRIAGSAIVMLMLAALLARPGLGAGLETQIAICATCHGAEGLPSEADIPIIWGQEFYYLYVQLRDYKAGRRHNEVMAGIVSDLGKEEMQALAQHFAEKNWPPIGFRAAEADVVRGESATASGLCSQCHLGSYHGNSRVPRVAGQQVAYLQRTMLEFKNKVRLNAPAKGSLFAAYEDGDIAAMARYLAGF